MGMINTDLSYWQAETEGIDLLDLTIGDLLDQRAEEFPSQEAIVYSCYPEFGVALNIRWTYQDYRNRANAVAKGLLALGLHKGDHIAVLAANLPDWPLLLMVESGDRRQSTATYRDQTDRSGDQRDRASR